MRFLSVAFFVTGMVFASVMSSRSGALVSPPALPGALTSGAGADCFSPGISADGRFVVFATAAGNLVTNDANGTFDVFVRDRQLGKTMRVSVNQAGTGSGNGASLSPMINSNGQLVVFESSASDLVPNDNNNAADVFLRNLVAGTTTLISVNTNGTGSGNLESSAPIITPDGRFVLFASRASNLSTRDTNNAVDLFVRDTVAGATAHVTRNSGNIYSFAGRSIVWSGNRMVSDDGRFVAFDSAVANLVSGDANNAADVFVRDLLLATNIPVSARLVGSGLGSGASQNHSMDGSGRYVAFQSTSSNLTANDTNIYSDVFLRDLVAGKTMLVSVNTNGTGGASSLAVSTSPTMSKQGNAVVFLSTANDLAAGDTNSTGADLFRRDVTAGVTTFVDSHVAEGGSAGAVLAFIPVISADGQFMLYQNSSRNLVLFDSASSSAATVAANVPGSDATMTDDARFVAYIGAADDSGVHNVYLFDRLGGTTEQVSLREPALPVATANAASHLMPGSVSSNGQFVVFESYASDWTAGDTNRTRDVWLCDLGTGTNGLVQLNLPLDGFSRGPARQPVISDDASWVAFEAIPDSAPWAGLATKYNLYLRDRLAQTNVLVAGVGKVSAASLPAFSRQGAFMTFQSSETGVGGFATTVSQIYFRDTAQDSNRLVSLSYLGNAAGSAASSNSIISPDGRYVAYLSRAANLVTNTVSTTVANAFLWDSMTGSNILVSAPGTSSFGVAQVAFWADGSLLSFQRVNTNYLFDVATRTIVATLPDAMNLALSADGRFVACERTNSYLAADTNNTTDVYLIDRTTSQVSLVSVNPGGTSAGNGKSLSPLITPDGRYVLFRSRASNLAANDANGVGDVFLRDTVLGQTILLSLNRNGSGSGNRFSGNAVMSADGRTFVFESYASDLVAGDFNEARDLLVLRLGSGDSDGDGLPDDWELAYFNTLARNGNGDLDGDGHTDSMEFQAGTNPASDASILRVVTLASPSSGVVRVFWSAVPGKTYRVQFKDSVTDPDWIDLVGDVHPGDTTGFKDDGTAGSATQRFYRVLLAQ